MADKSGQEDVTSDKVNISHLSSGREEHQHEQDQQEEAPKEPPQPSETVQISEAYEETHVHSVYEAIAPHFSSTRHKPWPLVTSFLLAQEPGCIGLDVGCGNGKYLNVNPRVHLLGSDRSAALVRLARSHGHSRPDQDSHSQTGSEFKRLRGEKEEEEEVIVADGLALPYRPAAADFAISIAVIHHLSTRSRRRDAVQALLRCVRPRGSVLVYVWALEQAASRRGWHEGDAQDTLVPWVMRAAKGQAKGSAAAGETYQRYYHLYREGELEEDVLAVGGTVLDAGYERDNWWVVCCRE